MPSHLTEAYKQGMLTYDQCHPQTIRSLKSPLRSLMVIGIASLVVSVLLAISELRGDRKRNFQKSTLLDGLLVGIA